MIKGAVEVIPGILDQDFAEIERKIRLVEPYVSWVQIDVLDGSLFNNSNFHEAKPFADLDTQLLMEAHLMVKNPAQYVASFFAAGFKRFIGHLEAFDHEQSRAAQAKGFTPEENVYDFLHEVRSFGAEVGLALDLPTPVEEVFPHLDSLDQVLIMTIPTGKSGQSFHEEALEKIKKIRETDPHIHIEVDGGINPETAKRAVAAGATRLAVTSAIFKKDDIKGAIDDLKNIYTILS